MHLRRSPCLGRPELIVVRQVPAMLPVPALRRVRILALVGLFRTAGHLFVEYTQHGLKTRRLGNRLTGPILPSQRLALFFELCFRQRAEATGPTLKEAE